MHPYPISKFSLPWNFPQRNICFPIRGTWTTELNILDLITPKLVSVTFRESPALLRPLTLFYSLVSNICKSSFRKRHWLNTGRRKAHAWNQLLQQIGLLQVWTWDYLSVIPTSYHADIVQCLGYILYARMLEVRSITTSHDCWRQLGRLGLMNTRLVFTRSSGSSPIFTTKLTRQIQ